MNESKPGFIYYAIGVFIACLCPGCATGGGTLISSLGIIPLPAFLRKAIRAIAPDSAAGLVRGL